ncbi:hypothetical protein SRB17_81940 [Streptomyces sp. RB17]|nr:hypothetical protein [Streptomyces sp. RB17]MQY40164.1 hypothetical protein [Streptomyces sp. RB17]
MTNCSREVVTNWKPGQIIDVNNEMLTSACPQARAARLKDRPLWAPR